MFKEKSQKQLQVAEQIKREMASIFLKEDIFNSSEFKVTISEADISPDLKNAKIYINIFGDIKNDKLISELNNNVYFFQKKLSKSIKLRNIPKIKFVYDDSSKRGNDISRAIKEEGDNINY